MESLLSQELHSYNHVKEVFADETAPFALLISAVEGHRLVGSAAILADFMAPETRKIESRLWATHSLAKGYYQKAIVRFRKLDPARPVETKALVKVYKDFLKSSARFYRECIYNKHATFGGIPELEKVAQQLKPSHDRPNEVPQTPSVSSEMQKCILASTHQELVYLGDLARYRASDRVDKQQNFGPAIGYYGLACTLRPDSGLGHHQQAVIALEQRHHLRAIYHLYRAMAIKEPHPNAAKNLKIEFDKVNTAWDRGELIQKAHPNDPDASKRALIGWFVRLHSMCYKGETFRGFDELEREVLGQLAAILKQRSLESTFTRMILTNMAAQDHAAKVFQDQPTAQSQQSVFYFLRLNIKMFTTLLDLFYDDLRDVYSSLEEQDADGDNNVLASRLEPIACRTLPGVRLYSCWIIVNVRIVCGLADDGFLKDAIEQLWRTYAKTLSLIAGVFSIWDLDEVPEVTYLLEEDVETLGFTPLTDEATTKFWNYQGITKKPFSDGDVPRMSLSDEMLGRVKDVLSPGLDMATSDLAPINLKGTKVAYKDEEPLPLPRKQVLPAEILLKNDQVSKKKIPAVKPTSWATIAANGRSKGPSLVKANSITSSHSRHAQLTRMVDDLVDDDDGSDPITPPPHNDDPNVTVAPNGDVAMETSQEFVRPNHITKPPPSHPQRQTPQPVTPNAPGYEVINQGTRTTPLVQANLSSIWESPIPSTSPFPSGLPMGTLSSPVHLNSKPHGHSRVNSASSTHSRNSTNMADRWAAVDISPKPMLNGLQQHGTFANGYENLERHGIQSPLLFGAGGGLWATGPKQFPGTKSPPNAQNTRGG